MPKLTVKMNRADPFFERDATGWQFINLHTGNVDVEVRPADNQNRTVAFDTRAGEPADIKYQAAAEQIPPQTHY